ncbi:MAG TPA: DMT family transporter [Rhodanobacteraceae bacterium]|nr:DMT family transporter [Rhodanobacteraceae bacterium]
MGAIVEPAVTTPIDQPSALPLRAVLMMVASASLFGVMVILIRYVSRDVHPFQIAFFRSFFGALAAAPLLLCGGVRMLRTDRLGFYVWRCGIGTLSMLAAFWAVVHLPLAQAVALSYSSPLFVTIGAVLFLGEVVRMRRWSAVIAGFLGVLIIVRPGSDAFEIGSVVALAGAAFAGAVTISIKFLSRSDPVDTIVLLTTWLWVPLTLPAALLVWQWPAATWWPWLVVIGVLGTAGQYTWTHALRLSEASSLAPFSYLQLVIVALLAWLAFAEIPDRYTVLGSLVVVGSSLYIMRREASLARRQRKQALAAAAEPDL